MRRPEYQLPPEFVFFKTKPNKIKKNYQFYNEKEAKKYSDW